MGRGFPGVFLKRPVDIVVNSEEIDEAAYAERVRQLIREGLESVAREPTISPEDAKTRLFAVIARVAEQSRSARSTTDPDTK
jgi:hypothetical protein